MYEFVTHTWNTVKGACYHDCSYCYMKRWGKLNPVRFDEKELKTDLGSGNFIFVGSSCDMWAQDIPEEWIVDTINHCYLYNNKYLFQTKNPDRILHYKESTVIKEQSVICTTIETNRIYPDVMNHCPRPEKRAEAMRELACSGIKTYVTIEPILDFEVNVLEWFIKMCEPEQVNIGADTGSHKLPEPSKEKILKLIERLSDFTIVHQKSNLKRLLK